MIMATDGYVQVAPDSTGKKIDNSELTVGADTVERQRVIIAGANDVQLADVLNTQAKGTEYGLVVRNLPADTDINLERAVEMLINEIRLLRQSFQSWSRSGDPYQPTPSNSVSIPQ